MYERIVVPLDGSRLAECSLPHVENLAQGCKVSEVVLISVTERVEGRTTAPEAREAYAASQPAGISGVDGPSGTRVTIGKKETQARKYLQRVAENLNSKGIPVRWEVRLGNPAEEIISFVKDRDAELIVMASHGRSGPSRWALGSVADKVSRASCVPVLIIRAPGCVAGI